MRSPLAVSKDFVEFRVNIGTLHVLSKRSWRSPSALVDVFIAHAHQVPKAISLQVEEREREG